MGSYLVQQENLNALTVYIKQSEVLETINLSLV